MAGRVLALKEAWMLPEVRELKKSAFYDRMRTVKDFVGKHPSQPLLIDDLMAYYGLTEEYILSHCRPPRKGE